MPEVWFIRHGESEGDKGRRTSLPDEIALTKFGRWQAECIARSFCRYKPPSLIITSKYRRAWQTAQPIIKRYPQARRARPDDWPVHEFTYLSPAKFAARTTKGDRQEKVKAYWECNDPYYVDGEGAESFTDFIKRVWGVVESLQSRPEDFIAVFTHGQFIAATQWLLEVQPNTTERDSMKIFKHFLDCNLVPNGAILPAELDREKSEFKDMIIPLEDEQRVDRLPCFAKEARRFITCEDFKLRPILI